MRRVALAITLATVPVTAEAQLHTNGSQLWYQGLTGVPGPAGRDDGIGSAVAAGDFDGDGRSDLAMGAYCDDVQGVACAGAVHVLYGAAQGLSAGGSQYWYEGSGQMPGSVSLADGFGTTLAAGDFNGDGRSDLAVGAFAKDINGLDMAGAVFVLYGSANGLTDAGSQIWYQGYNGLYGAPEEDDFFGESLAAGDFDGDGRDDLAIGSWEGVAGFDRAGMVQILYGTSNGLSAQDDQFWHQALLGIPGEAQEKAWFGSALAAADFDGDGRDDLAIGSLGTIVSAQSSAGAVTVLYGSASGLTTTGVWQFHRDSPGIPGTSAAWARFGYALAAGDFNADGHADLAVGAPDHWHFSTGSGSLNVVYGSANGLQTADAEFWRQGYGLLPGSGQPGDLFGAALSTGDFDADGYADLAVGIPLKEVGSMNDAGVVQIIYGGSLGLTAAGSQLWSQDSASVDPVPGVAEAYDHFGSSLAGGDFDGDGVSDLAVGVQREDVGSVKDAGAVNVLYGSDGLRHRP